jgi:hypothetical protein
MNLRQRGRQYQRFPCELRPEQIARIRALGDATNLAYAEVTRRAFDFALYHPDFLTSISFRESLSQSEVGDE